MKSAEPKSSTSSALQRKSYSTAFFQQEGSKEAFFGSKQADTPFFKPAQNNQQPTTNNQQPIQAKLKIGAPDDHFEKEADATADKVVQRLAEKSTTHDNPPPSTFNPPPSTVQRKCAECEQEEVQREEELSPAGEQVQMKPIFDSAAEPPPASEGGGDDEIRRKPIFESNQEENPPLEGGAGGEIQRKCAECAAEEDSQQIQRSSETNSASEASPDVASRLQSSKGGGSPLPDDTRSEMEGAFGADFSGVRIHTGGEAEGMSNDLQAQAFTHGSDIYFNKGKYDTGSTDGKHLLAHELTHTMQQGGGGIKKKSKKSGINQVSEVPDIQRAWYNFSIPFTDYVFDPSLSGVKNAAKITAGAVGTGAKWAWGQAKNIGKNALACARATGTSIWKLVRGDFDSLADLVGKPAPMGRGPELLEWVIWALNHPCLKMIPGYNLMLGMASKLPTVIQFLKTVWHVMTNPQLIVAAIKDALGTLIAKIPEAAKAAVQKFLATNKKLQKHSEGIWRHLEPKLKYMADNWWEIIKSAGRELLFPWEGIGGDLEEIWIHLENAGSQLWDLALSAAWSSLNAAWRAINALVGKWYLYICALSVLIGALVGGIPTGGIGAPAGALAGFKVCLAIGKFLLFSMIAEATSSIAQAIADLAKDEQTEEENEEDYEQIANSGLTLAIIGVMFLLGALAVRFARGLLNKVKGIFRKKTISLKPYVNNNPKATPDEIRIGEFLNNKAQKGELPKVESVEGAAESKTGRSGDYRFNTQDGKQVSADLYQPESGNPNSIASHITQKSGQAEVVVVELGRGKSVSISSESAQSMAQGVVDTPGHSINRVIVIKDGKIITNVSR